MKKEEIIKKAEEEHRRYHRRLVNIVLVLMLLLFGGAVFYFYAEGWNYINALYFSAATMTTVGYGDLTPKTNISKVFTIFYMFASVSMALYGLSLLASHFIETREEFWLSRIAKDGSKQNKGRFFRRLRSLFSRRKK